MKNILALDLGTKCGYAEQRAEGINVIYSGVWDLKAKSHESIGQRYLAFQTILEEIFMFRKSDIVVYEEVKFHRGVEAAHVYGAFEGVLQATCLRYGIEYRGVGVSEIQKHATGRGMAPKGQKKAAMFEAAARLFPSVNVIDENQADALCLLSMAMEKF